MHTLLLHTFAVVTFLGVSLRCSDPIEPDDDIAEARATWLATRPDNYYFEINVTSFVSSPGYYQVWVLGDVVESARDPDGQPDDNFDVTIDDVWDQLLAALDDGELRVARFDRHGVPVEVSFGDFSLDSGVTYRIRNFREWTYSLY
jgi:hypothetical protein